MQKLKKGEPEMLLVIDAGNTNITIGIYKNDNLLFVSRLATDRTLTEDQFAININSIFSLNNLKGTGFDGAVISSVVPEITSALENGVKKVTGKKPTVIGPGIKTGLNIRLDSPAELGADLAATAVGALSKYPLPCLILDLGTATKITVLDETGAFLGGAIAPGIKISLNALAMGASQLSQISLKAPKKAIGSNTTECMRSGIVYGTADMLDGICARMEKELSVPVKTIVATGGLCSIVEHCTHPIVVDENLLLEGLKVIYEKNKK